MLLEERMSDEMKGFDRNSMPPQLNQNNAQPDSPVDTMNEQLLNILKIISHDLRGSLISILATLKLLNRGYYGKTDENVKIKLEELFGKMKGLIGMTEEYLGRAFSVNEDLEIERETLDLRQDIIKPILEELSTEIKDRRIQIDNRLDSISKGLISLKGSKVWLKAVFRNLLKNAINYGDTGGIIAFGFEENGSMYQVNIYNSGKPISEERRDKLFLKFAHNGNNNNGRSNGMGLGLYFAKMIMRKHGGDIWYEAKEHGSNFVMIFPIEAVDSKYEFNGSSRNQMMKT